MASPLGYVVLYFPKLSETFIVEELLALDGHGVRPNIYARDPLSEATTNRRADTLLARATWLRSDPLLRQVFAVLSVAIRHPYRTIRCANAALASRSRWTLLNLWFGMVLAARAKRDGIRYLHAHFGGDAAELAYFAARLLDIPFGMTIHAVEIYIGRMMCEKARRAALLVTVCAYNVAQMVERCPDRAGSEYLVKFAGIDADEFRLTSARPARTGRLILAIGRLTPKKGFDHLIRAVRMVADDGLDVECRIVGDRRDSPELHELANELGVANLVTFVGSATPEELRRHLRDADVLAAPCTIAPWGDRDSMPVVLKEAMAMELPVVSTDDFGIPELVTPDAGVLVPRDDVPALAAALKDVLSRSADERARMGRAGRDIVRTRFHEPELVIPLIAAFDRVAGAPP